MNKQKEQTHRHNITVVISGEVQEWEVEEVKGDQVCGDRRRRDFGWWAHNGYTDDVLYNCTFESYIILLINVTP